MSGGSFEYAYQRVENFAYELSEKLDLETELKPETVEKLRQIERLARKTAAFMKETEWLYSGDTGEGSFMRRIFEIEKGL